MKNYSVICTLLFAFIFQLTAQTITTQPTNQAVLAGDNVTFSVVVSGTGPFTYQWQFNGTNLPSGIITTVAGNGTNSFSGDGGVATSAALKSPMGATVDAVGNLFIADGGNNRIRRVDTNGIITTVSGNGVADFSFSSEGAAATTAAITIARVAVDIGDNLLISDYHNHRIRKVDTNGIIRTVAGNGTNFFRATVEPRPMRDFLLPV